MIFFSFLNANAVMILCDKDASLLIKIVALIIYR